ncbi:unnamed protein product, partial [Brassica oleracea var. botrytis]
MGATVDQSVTGTAGPFSYRVHGQIIHRIGSLLPNNGKLPEYLQLYIFDTGNELENRKKAFTKDASTLALADAIILELIKMLDNHNNLARTFRHARDRIQDAAVSQFKITLVSQPNRGRQYDLPTASEIGGLVVGDITASTVGRDIVVELRSSSLQRISDLHPLMMSLQYPLLFPYGEPGYHERLPYEEEAGAELYNNVCDAVENGDADATQLGKKVILPSSFTAGPRYMAEKYQDAMAICRWYGNPHLFITVTANPNWVELKYHLDAYGCKSGNSRPDLECRIFKIKLDEMISYFKKGIYFPKPDAVVYTIEFQKRGLPHAHILLWLKVVKKEVSAATIDEYISAELPDKDVDKESFELVERHMIHGPCGRMRPTSPCMDKEDCTKNYPKPLSDHTRIDKSGFVVYRRRADTNALVVKGNIQLNNQFVVPHNLSLLKKYQAHINVEWCCRSSAIKYLFKYIIKGVNRATMLLEESDSACSSHGDKKKKADTVKEIDRFIQGRYISACEASWRIFAFPIHYNQPNVVKLPLHLPGQHRAVFDQSDDLAEFISREDADKTMLTAFVEACNTYEEARELTYIEFPSRFVYHPSDKTWTPRQQGEAIGRVVYISPGAGDLYFFRILINVVRGPRGFDAMYAVGDVVYKEYKDACFSRGLLDDDNEWHKAIEEPSYWATGRQLRRLFVIILVYCQLWNHTCKLLSEDILYIKRKEFNFPGLELEDEQLKQYTLLELDKLLKEHKQTLADYTDMPRPEQSILSEINDTVLQQELNYDVQKEAETHGILFDAMNQDQRIFYNAVLESIRDQSGRLFFVYGAGGTGKRYL